MSKNRERNLNVVSGIDEELIDKATKTRIRYFSSSQKNKRKNFIPIIAIAAAVAILFSLAAIILVPMLAKHVPVYTGMSVSSAGFGSANAGGSIPLSATVVLDNDNHSGNNGNHGANNPNKKPIEDLIDSSIEVESEKELYYAKSGETVRVTIHFNNPDQYEILSFTLNGEKYGSHMFLEGSNMEDLTVEYTIPRGSNGIVECTIDAIKYVDGTSINDVKIGGDKTVRIGIYTEKQPVAEITDEVIDINEMSFKVKVTDKLKLIALTGGKLKAVITDGESIIAEQELTVGELATVKFENLKTLSCYEYAIVAQYDALDGKGYANHILYQKEIMTREVVTFTSVSSDKTSINFSLLFNENAETKEITKIELYLGENKVKDIDSTATEITGLLSNNEYRIVVSYVHRGKTEQIEYTVKTLAKEMPTVELKNYVSDFEYVSFSIVEAADPDNIGEMIKAELYDVDGTLVRTLALNSDIKLEDLELMDEYSVIISIRCDYNDGKGTVTEQITRKIATATSEGLEYSNGQITGIGSCADTVLYMNKPIAESAFSGNSRITKIVLGRGVTSIGTFAFYRCPRLSGTVDLSNVTKIEAWAFSGCEKISGVILGNKLELIDGYAFGDCTKLSGSVDLSSVRIIGNGAFQNTNISGQLDLSNATSIGDSAFEGCQNISTELDLSNVTSIGRLAFYGCDIRGTVDLSNLTAIAKGVFYGCKNLEGVIVGEKLESIGEEAFSYCTKLSKIDLSNVTIIGEWAFAGCTSLSTADISNVTDISGYTFLYCSNLSSVILGKDLETIGSFAFGGCTNLNIYYMGSENDWTNSVTRTESWNFIHTEKTEKINIPVHYNYTPS